MKLTDCRQKAQSTVFVPSESNTKIDNDMLPSRKIYMGITSAALIALGIISICRPAATIISIDQAVDEKDYSIKVYAKVKEANSAFRPGMYVRAKLVNVKE